MNMNTPQLQMTGMGIEWRMSWRLESCHEISLGISGDHLPGRQLLSWMRIDRRRSSPTKYKELFQRSQVPFGNLLWLNFWRKGESGLYCFNYSWDLAGYLKFGFGWESKLQSELLLIETSKFLYFRLQCTANEREQREDRDQWTGRWNRGRYSDRNVNRAPSSRYPRKYKF